jgi:putative hydrolase of the HAD superfamily
VEPRAAAFDIDGTLYANAPMYLLSALHAVPRLRFLKAFARVRKRIREIYPIDDFEELQVRLLADAMGIGLDKAEERIRRWFDRELDSIYRHLQPFAHVRSCIEELRAAGLKTAVLSDFPIGRKLEYLGLEGLWDCRLASQESGYLKPRIEPFLMLSECLGERPEHIVYIGNSYEYDIVGASNAGMRTAHLVKRPVNGKADISFANYRDLSATILGDGRGAGGDGPGDEGAPV